MTKDYSDLTKDELLFLIQKLNKNKKYGLIWDEEAVMEKVALDCKERFPILKRNLKKSILDKNSISNHVLINGDNYHALSVLLYTHKNSIDLIYIDPPYNTGNKEDEEGFVYNDKRVDSEDSYKHSKWLNFMIKRLSIARDLLTNTGLIFISIDEHEFAQLKLLCDEIFGESNFVNFLTWKKRSTGGQVKDGSIITQTEFIYIYAKNKKDSKVNKIENPNVGTEKWRDFRKSGGQWQKRYRPKQFYPFYFDLNKHELYLERKSKKNIEIYPTDSKGVEGFWENGLETAKIRLLNGELKAEKIKSGELAGMYKIKQLEVAGDSQNVGNYVDIPSVQGANEIKNLGLKFNNPKPLALIEFILKIGGNKNSVILDFFAGSGTTGHAVMSLNAQDEGKRKAILCTNNETNPTSSNGILDDVTIPRLTKASKGYKNQAGKSIEGLNGNWHVFDTDFIKTSNNKDQLKLNFSNECDEIIALKEFTFKKIREEEEYTIFENDNKILGVYKILNQKKLSEFKTNFEKSNKEQKVAYIFTLSNNGLSNDYSQDWGDVILKDFPQKIIENYKRIFNL